MPGTIYVGCAIIVVEWGLVGPCVQREGLAEGFMCVRGRLARVLFIGFTTSRVRGSIRDLVVFIGVAFGGPMGGVFIGLLGHCPIDGFGVQ